MKQRLKSGAEKFMTPAQIERSADALCECNTHLPCQRFKRYELFQNCENRQIDVVSAVIAAVVN